MTPGEKVTLRDLALQLALSKLQALAGVQAHLQAAMEQCRGWQNAHHTFGDDTEVHELKEKIQALFWSTRLYSDAIFAAVTGRESGEFDYVDGNDMLRLRQAEAEARGIVFDEDDDRPYDKLPHEDPLTLFLRLKAETGQ